MSRKNENGGTSFAANCGAAALATTVSSPFNFFRNIQFSVTPSCESKTMKSIAITLLEQMREKPNAVERARFVQQRFRLGWGTGRVAIGMGLVSQCYEKITE